MQEFHSKGHIPFHGILYYFTGKSKANFVVFSNEKPTGLPRWAT